MKVKKYTLKLKNLNCKTFKLPFFFLHCWQVTPKEGNSCPLKNSAKRDKCINPFIASRARKAYTCDSNVLSTTLRR